MRVREFHYILDEDGKTPVAVYNVVAWADWMESRRKSGGLHVGDTLLDADGTRISTVFLGNDHNFMGDGPQQLFETMIFGGPCDEYMERYATWAEAEAGHRKAVEMAAEAASRRGSEAR